MRIGIFGHYGNGNLGDEAITESAIDSARRILGADEVCLFSIIPGDSAFRHSLDAFPLRRGSVPVQAGTTYSPPFRQPRTANELPEPEDSIPERSLREWLKRSSFLKSSVNIIRALIRVPGRIAGECTFLAASMRTLDRIDLMIVAGSNQYLDNFGGVLGFPYTLMKWALMCRLKGVKITFLSIGAGPIDKALSRVMVRIAIKQGFFHSYRDQASLHLIEGPSARLGGVVHPDLASNLQFDVVNIDYDSVRPVVAINPMPVYGDYWFVQDDRKYNSYLKKLATFAEYLNSCNCKILMFPTQIRDMDAIEDLMHILQGRSPSIAAKIEIVPTTTSQEVMQVIQSAHVVVPTRFHGAVLSVLAKRLTIGVCYQAKAISVLEAANQKRYAFMLDDVTPDELASAFDHLWQNREHERKEVTLRSEVIRSEVDAQYGTVRALLDKMTHGIANLMIVALTLPFVVACGERNAAASSAALSNEHFEYREIDSVGPNSAWGKGIGDLNGDGRDDVIVGGHEPKRLSIAQRLLRKLGRDTYSEMRGELVWYESPKWNKHVISLAYSIRTDVEAADIDGDGDLDVIALTDNGVIWFKNPEWTSTILDDRKYHDVEVDDLNGDGLLDLVTRNQSLFGYDDGNVVRIFYQSGDDSWRIEELAVPHGEGLVVDDINNDSAADIIVNGSVFLNASPSGSAWQRLDYADSNVWSDVYIDVDDFDADGAIDIALSPSEPVGKLGAVAWFRNPGNDADPWKEIRIDDEVEAVRHFIGAADFNLDGMIDVATAAMPQGNDTAEVAVYLNDNRGESWSKIILATGGSHNMQIFDANGDFAPDLMGSHWQLENEESDYPVQLWLNKNDSHRQWRRQVIDDRRKGQATSVRAADIDGDGLTDIVSGAFWYRNSGAIAGPWTRQKIGDHANDAAVLYDFDKDGRVDILASKWLGNDREPTLLQRFLNRTGIRHYDYENKGNELVWARNLGDGDFEILHNIDAAQGDYLQGADVLLHNGDTLIVLSWHDDQSTLQSLKVPDNPKTSRWTWTELSTFSENEAVSTIDIDSDGNYEIVTGSHALYSRGREWLTVRLISTQLKPDRHLFADMNDDSMPDLIVGYEAVSKPGKLAWYELNTESAATEHVIATLIGPMSLSSVDLDGDGDMDVIAGEHNLNEPENARLVWFENLNSVGTSWAARLIHVGDEHHDGALATDIDGDGDIDIVSIGWGHNLVIVYENLDT